MMSQSHLMVMRGTEFGWAKIRVMVRVTDS